MSERKPTQRDRVKALERDNLALKNDVRKLHGMVMQLAESHNKLVEGVKQLASEAEQNGNKPRILLP